MPGGPLAGVQASQLFDHLLRNSTDATMLVKDDTIVAFNRATLRCFNATESDVPRLLVNPGRLSPPSQPDGTGSLQHASELIDLAWQTGCQTFEWQHARFDGSTFPAEVHLVAMPVGVMRLLYATFRDITAQRKADRLLRDSEERFSKAFHLSPAPMCIIARDGGHLQEANRAFQRLVGYSQDELVGRTTAELGLWANPEDRAFVRQVLETGSSISEREYHFRTKAGETVVCRLSVSQVDQCGTSCELAELVDVTKLRRVEQELRQSEERYRTIFRDTLEALSLSHNGRLVDVNTPWLTLHGYSDPAEVIGSRVTDHMLAADRVLFLREAGESAPRTGLRTTEARDVRKDGSIVEVEVTSSWVSIGGAPMAIAAVRDIGERRRAAAEIERRTRELAALRDVVMAAASSPELHEALSRALQAIGRTLGFEHMGFVLPDLSGSLLNTWSATAKEVGDDWASEVVPMESSVCRQAWTNGKPVLVQDAEGAPEHVGIRKDTRSEVAVPVMVGTRALAVLNAVSSAPNAFSQEDVALLETIAGHLAVVLENARLYEAERAQRRLLEQSRAQLIQSEKLAATGRLAATLAHEINNPLQAIQNSLQLVRDDGVNRVEREEFLQLASMEVERLAGLAGRILGFARRAEGQSRLVDVNGIIREILSLSSKFLQHSQIQVRLTLDPDLPVITATLGELDQVFLNLVINAAEAMPMGGVLAIATTLLDAGCIQAHFSDSGCGFTAEQKAYAFEPFFTTKERGTGLGLSVSHDIVKRHGGRIEILSDPGQGATVVVELPCTRCRRP